MLDGILSGMEAIGKTPESVTVVDLFPVDVFHIGERQASEELIGQMELSANTKKYISIPTSWSASPPPLKGARQGRGSFINIFTNGVQSK